MIFWIFFPFRLTVEVYVPTIKITDLSILCKWGNLKNQQCIKYLFAPLYIYIWDGMRVKFHFNPFSCNFVCSAMLNFYYRCTKYVFDLCHCILFRFLPLTKLLYVCQKKKYFYFFNTWVQFKVELFLLLLKYVFGQILVLLSIFTFTWVKYLSTFSLKLISYLLHAVFALRVIILLVFCHLIAVVYFTVTVPKLGYKMIHLGNKTFSFRLYYSYWSI